MCIQREYVEETMPYMIEVTVYSGMLPVYANTRNISCIYQFRELLKCESYQTFNISWNSDVIEVKDQRKSLFVYSNSRISQHVKNIRFSSFSYDDVHWKFHGKLDKYHLLIKDIL